MCIAIYKPKGKTIPYDYLEEGYFNNPDGSGFMFTENGKINVVKTMGKFETFYKLYNKIVPEDKTVILHFRISTSGGINLNNCHPFSVNKHLAFCHNGVIDIKLTNKKLNDTRHFNNKILKNLPVNFLKDKAIVELIKGYIGSSKLVFLDNSGKTTIINADLGQWENGIWYSNSSYKPYIAEKNTKLNLNKYDYYCVSCDTVLNENEIEYNDGYCIDCWLKFSTLNNKEYYGNH